MTIQQPDFSGAFATQAAIQLPATTQFGYAAWLTKKGNLLLQIAPLKSVRHYQQPSARLQGPVSIHHLIERLFPTPDEDTFN